MGLRNCKASFAFFAASAAALAVFSASVTGRVFSGSTASLVPLVAVLAESTSCAAFISVLKDAAEGVADLGNDVAGGVADIGNDVAGGVADFGNDVADAARKTVRWTGNAAEDVADWATAAPGNVKAAIMRAAEFVDDVTDTTSNGMMSAAEAVDDVLGDLEETVLPDGVVITVGPFDISNDGVSFKPKFEIGLETPTLDFSLGIEDLRDGLSVGITLDVILFQLRTEGDDLQELLTSFEIMIRGREIMHDAMDDGITGLAVSLLSEPVLPRAILEASGLNLSGFGTVRLDAKLVSGVGLRGEIGLGKFWPDTQGYRMFGVGGEIALKLKLKVDLFVGYKDDASAFRLVIGLPPGLLIQVEWLAPNSVGRDVLSQFDEASVEGVARLVRELLLSGPYITVGERLL